MNTGAKTDADRKEAAKAVICSHLVGKMMYLKKGMVSHKKEEIPNNNRMLQVAIDIKKVLTIFAAPEFAIFPDFDDLMRHISMNRQNKAVCSVMVL